MKKRITWNSAQTWTPKIVHHHGTQATLICSHTAIRILRKCGSTRAGCGYPHLRSGFGLTCCRAGADCSWYGADATWEILCADNWVFSQSTWT